MIRQRISPQGDIHAWQDKPEGLFATPTIETVYSGINFEIIRMMSVVFLPGHVT